MSVKKIAFIIAPGFEEIEAIAPYDIFKRAGIDVGLFSLSNDSIVASDRGLKICCDDLCLNLKIEDWNAIFLPGGRGGVYEKE